MFALDYDFHYGMNTQKILALENKKARVERVLASDSCRQNRYDLFAWKEDCIAAKTVKRLP